MTRGCVVRGGCALLVAVMLVGCSEKPVWEVAYPATGVLTYKGRPVPNADIVLFPEDSTWPETVRPRARTKEDGTFEIWTYEPGDGAPAGTYRATLVRAEVGISKGAVVAKPNDLPKKYERPDTSNVRVAIVRGESRLPAISL